MRERDENTPGKSTGSVRVRAPLSAPYPKRPPSPRGRGGRPRRRGARGTPPSGARWTLEGAGAGQGGGETRRPPRGLCGGGGGGGCEFSGPFSAFLLPRAPSKIQWRPPSTSSAHCARGSAAASKGRGRGGSQGCSGERGTCALEEGARASSARSTSAPASSSAAMHCAWPRLAAWWMGARPSYAEPRVGFGRRVGRRRTSGGVARAAARDVGGGSGARRGLHTAPPCP